jgi:peptide/nickel transport system substrate-binding protein
VVAAVLAGCNSGDDGAGGSGREGGSVVVGLATAPDSMDPAVASTPEALQAVWLAHTPPLTYARREGAAGTVLVPGLAEKAPKPSGDRLTWEFTVRRGLTYSDESRVRASDFERGIRRARGLNPRARRAFGRVKAISADDRSRRVRIDLERPDPLLPYALASTWASPVPAGTPSRELAAVPGVGPYVVARPERGLAYVLTRRRALELPGIPRGNVDVISGRVVPSVTTRTTAAIAGTLDAMQGEPLTTALPEIRSKYKDRYAEHRTLSSHYVRFDLDRSPFRDEDMRRAVSFALDERTLMRLQDGFLSPSCNMIPPAVAGHRAADPCPYGERDGNADLVEARDLADGSPDGDARVLVDGGTGRAADALARYGVETLDKIGLRARRARTAAERNRAQLRFTSTQPAVPHPARYLEPAGDALLASRVGLLELAGPPAEEAGRWAELDRDVVSDALLAPYGVGTTGTLLSERLDAENCLRFHPLHGLDLSSLCVR